jgi:hypothetical protein
MDDASRCRTGGRLISTPGRRTALRRLSPADRAGVTAIVQILLTPDARGHAYTYIRNLSDLYLASGLR